MKRNMGVPSAVSIGVAGNITTVVLNRRSVLRKGARAASGFAKAVANLAKKLGAVLGARGQEFLSRNLRILAVALAYFLYREYREYTAPGGPSAAGGARERRENAASETHRSASRAPKRSNAAVPA